MSQYIHIVCKPKGNLLGLGQFLATEISLEMMKNAFYLTSKAFFVHFKSSTRYLNFCFDFLLMYKNGLIRKVWLVSIHILQYNYNTHIA